MRSRTAPIVHKRPYDIPSLREDLAGICDNARRLVHTLSEDDLRRPPDLQTWSVLDNFEHLRLMAEVFFPFAERAISATRSRGAFSSGPFALGIWGKALMRWVEPPPLFHLPAPHRMKPRPQPADVVIPAFFASQERVDRLLLEAEGLDLAAFRFGISRVRFIRMNLFGGFSMLNGHARRHIVQAQHAARRWQEANQTQRIIS